MALTGHRYTKTAIFVMGTSRGKNGRLLATLASFLSSIRLMTGLGSYGDSVKLGRKPKQWAKHSGKWHRLLLFEAGSTQQLIKQPKYSVVSTCVVCLMILAIEHCCDLAVGSA